MEEVVPPPPSIVVEEEVVLQPPPMVVVEEEGEVQEPPFVEEEEVVQELPDPYALLAQWATATLAHGARCRALVATGVDDIISRCEEARLKLHEIVAVLVQEPGDAAEILYADLLELAPPGLDSLLLLDPAAKLVDSLFNWPGPLAGAVDAATALLSDTFYFPDPNGPLQAARRDLAYLVNVVHVDAGLLFVLYVTTLGLLSVPGGRAALEFWVANHNQPDAQATVALHRLHIAVNMSIRADLAVRLCRGPSTLRVRPQAGVRVSAAVLRLLETITEVVHALVALRTMRNSLVQLEQTVINITSNAQDPPHP